MQFNSMDFMFFFPIVIAIYFIIPKRLRKIWLLIASYYFYMSWNAVYSLLIGGSTVVTYISGILISWFGSEHTGKGRAKQKIVLTFCLVINLAILVVFKYGNFLIESLNVIFGMFGIQIIHRRLDLLLPVGISFYTFQALG